MSGQQRFPANDLSASAIGARPPRTDSRPAWHGEVLVQIHPKRGWATWKPLVICGHGHRTEDAARRCARAMLSDYTAAE